MKNKLTAQDIINFFQEKPMFSKPDSIKYGWSPTSGGLYSISDIYNYFNNFSKKEVDEVIWKFFQTNSGKLEKGKTHYLKILYVKNFNPDYSKRPYFSYYYYDISIKEALIIKEMYEKESKASMVLSIEKTKANKVSLSQAIKSKPVDKKPIKI